MKTWIMCTILFLAATVPCLCGTVPALTAQVNVTGAAKEYVYTLVNDLDSGEAIYHLTIYMPEAGAAAVTQAGVSRSGWFTGWNSRSGWGAWAAVATSGNELPSGGELVFTLTTPATVPTLDHYSPPFGPANWQWAVPSGVSYGTASVAVPVPEPGGLIGLVSGLGALGLPLLRGRRRR